MDLELGLAYLPVEAATGDYFGANRPGNNLFAESLVAVDLRTGERRWHYQLVHHGIWDHDIPCAPILLDLTIGGETVKAVAQPTKQVFLYVFNRETGEPIWPIEEQPVPAGDVPGEWYAPTQPIPTRPPAYDRQGVTLDDLIDFTPELRAEAEELVSHYQLGPIFTPPVVSRLDGPLGTLMAPAAGGGTNWPGGSYDPDTHILYVSSNSSVGALGLMPPYPGQSDMDYIQGNAIAGPRTSGGAGSSAGGGRTNFDVPPRPPITPELRRLGRLGRLSVQGLPLLRPPYGTISAIDMDRGEILWQIPHGETPDSVRNHRALRGLQLPRTGQPGSVGTLVTQTLLIAGGRRGAHHSDGTAGRHAPRLRQGDRRRGERRLHAGAPDRVADDLRARRRPVSGRRHQRRQLLGRAGRVQAARGLAARDRLTGRSRLSRLRFSRDVRRTGRGAQRPKERGRRLRANIVAARVDTLGDDQGRPISAVLRIQFGAAVHQKLNN